MADTPGVPAGMTLERLGALLDAYGADPDRWPVAEREPALTLLAASDAARSLRAAAARLDAVLDQVVLPAPSSDLVARILADTPGASTTRRRSILRWRTMAVAVPLAAAAAFLFWLFPRRNLSPSSELTQYAIEELGVYTSPTDLLLEPPGFDLSGMPTLGCNENDLGCPKLDLPLGRESRRHRIQRGFA